MVCQEKHGGTKESFQIDTLEEIERYNIVNLFVKFYMFYSVLGVYRIKSSGIMP